MAKRKWQERTQEKRLAAIDRFAGSSEDEDGDDDEEEEVPMKTEQPKRRSEAQQEEAKAPAGGDPPREERTKAEESKVDDDSEEDDILTEAAPSGMANAMARILSSATENPVLSKTTTKLQLQASQEAQELKALKSRRKLNREKRLSNYHVPSSGEVEVVQERSHRRVATRGVVALFNAIAQHKQNTTKKDETTKSKIGKEEFLNLIQNTTKQQQKQTKEPPVPDVKWDALNDQFPVSSKKNWDEESSSDEEHPDKELIAVEEENDA